MAADRGLLIAELSCLIQGVDVILATFDDEMGHGRVSDISADVLAALIADWVGPVLDTH